MPAYYHVDAASDRIPMQIVRKETPLSVTERAFILAVERGDYGSVRQALEEADIYFNLNKNCVDSLGRTGLLIAIQNENIEIIELLLKHNVSIGDALLHAIDEEVVEAVELLLNYKAPKKDIRARILQEQNETDFTPDISPVVLAAHRNNYEILKILLERGASIPKPHNVKCGCDDCISSIRHDGLRHSRSRLNIYRALASPSLISLSSEDPILTAFELSWELRKLSYRENEFKAEYDKLVEQCREFATDLLDQTRGSKELECILNRDNDSPTGEDPLSRLRLALKYKQKQFVAHPNCQQLIAEVWYQGLPGWRRQHFTVKLLISFFVGLSFPLLSLVYLLAPRTRLGKILRLPFLKFMCHSATYLVFLVLLIMASLPDLAGQKPNKRVNERAPAPSDIEILIVLWVLGYLWAEVKQLWDMGLQQYQRDWWNSLDFVTNTLYITVIGLRVTAYVNLRIIENKAHGPLIQLREEWDQWDPTLMAEATFAVANIFSMLRVVYFFTANSQLGPLQISLGRMVEDIIKFLFLMGLVLFAFGAGLNQLYWVYQVEVDEGQCFGVACDNPNNAFTDVFQTLQALIWALFGLTDLSNTKVKPEYGHNVTEFIGATMFGVYCITTIIVLLNLLIAMMNDSFQKIQMQSDMEWKFARSKLWMSYFDEGETLPVPFNIIPSPKSLYYIFRKIYRLTCKKKLKPKPENRNVTKLNLAQRRRLNDEEYQKVMKNLIKRYLNNSRRGERAEGVSEDDLNEIKQDISAFRYEILEILKGGVGQQPKAAGGAGKAGGAGGVGGVGDKKDGEERKTKAVSMGSIVGSFSVSTISSASSGSPQLERVPSYLLRKGKKNKRSPQHRETMHVPLKCEPIQEEDYALPDFLKMKNVKNVVSAVNEMKRSSRKRRLQELVGQSLSSTASRKERVREDIEEDQDGEDAEEVFGAAPPGSPRRLVSQASLDMNDEEMEMEVMKGSLIEPESNGNKTTSSEDESDEPLVKGTKELARRVKSFAGQSGHDNGALHLDESGVQGMVRPPPLQDNSGDSQSTSGIASPNNSFQSQDSVDGEVGGPHLGPGDSDSPSDPEDDVDASTQMNVALRPKGKHKKMPPKRTSFLWGSPPAPKDGEDVEMTRFQYNDFKP
ncbi:short transient receptor potential channel 4-like [Patiria miniata]|uniref:Transient receptor ion channel domain-containing protein n=1 Tax=Patiria miniata TaxID=46514 RepID=A0A913ZVJ1_PATMI|nr:short transient receptor potential channel 4-like [Patiria miniata]XP_038055092.1 short transient receptor potential channel 4-like [Patiria miniata]